jgi:hypothetical protein
MAPKDPHFRAYHALEIVDGQRTRSDDKKTQELVKVLKGTSSDHRLCYAWDKFTDDISRIILDSFILADATFDVIRRTVGVPIDVLDRYASHVFDVSVFRDLLERISYVRTTKEYLAPDHQAFLEAAINKGPEYIVWLINGSHGKSPKDILESTMAESHFVGLGHRGAAITSEQARQARGWLDTSMKAATNLQRLDPRDDQDALAELKLTLAHSDRVLSAEDPDAPRPEDIVH